MTIEHERVNPPPASRAKPPPTKLPSSIGDLPPMPEILFPELEFTANDLVVGALSGGA